MTRLLKKLFGNSNPVITTSAWLPVFLVIVTVGMLPLGQLSRSAYSFNDGQRIDPPQNKAPLWSTLSSFPRLVQLDANAMGGTKQNERAGKRIGLQAGHWRYWESPPPYNAQTGTSAAGKTEPEVTLDIARRAAKILTDMGYTVDVLPAWFQQDYKADAVVAIHADGAGNEAARGFFADRYGDSAIPSAADQFVKTLDAAYADATGLPFVDRSTPDSHYYYGYKRVTSKTPMALIETGFLTSPDDRQIIVGDPDKSAQGIANGVDQFLMSQGK